MAGSADAKRRGLVTASHAREEAGLLWVVGRTSCFGSVKCTLLAYL